MKNLKDNKMDLDIQLFAEMADNTEGDDQSEVQDEVVEDGASNATSEGEETPEEKKQNDTKAYSERLNKERKEMREALEKEYAEKRDTLAHLRGYDNWDEFENAIDSDALLDAGVSDVDKLKPVLETLINKNPQVLKAKEIIENAEKERKEKILNDEVTLIHEVDPDINSLDDIKNSEKSAIIIDKITKGYSLYDAYVTTNYEKIQGLKVQTEKRSAAQNVQSKNHMKTTTGGAGDSTIVPEDVMNMYKRNLPKWTNEQIRTHYEQTLKEDSK